MGRATIFIEQGFVATVQQFRGQGYPLAGVFVGFLDPRKVLDSIPHELFGSQPSTPLDGILNLTYKT